MLEYALSRGQELPKLNFPLTQGDAVQIYEKEEAFFRQQQGQGLPPHPGFNEYKKSGAAGGIMGMIQEIINDGKTMEADATRAESESEPGFGSSV